MRYLILAVLLLAPGLITARAEICNSSITVNTVTVASHTATLIEGTSVVMPGRKWVEYQNKSTDTIHCSQLSSVTSDTGRLITANGGTWELSMSDVGYDISVSTYAPYQSATTNSLKMYCRGGGTNITSKLTITQCK